MGVLKHAILPFLALTEVAILGVYFSGNLAKFPEWMQLPGAENARTPIEMHFMAMTCAGSAVLLFGCLVGIFYENSHFRAMVAAMHVIVFAMDSHNCWGLGEGWDYKSPGALCLLCVVGLLAHSQEPGLFTTDKNNNEMKKQ